MSPLRVYVPRRFALPSLDVIDTANEILAEYGEQGFDLTLRQLYYQFVAHDRFPDDRTWSYNEKTRRWVRDPRGTKNADPNYKWLGDIVNDARLAGLIDWYHIVDRTRFLRSGAHWESPEQIIRGSAAGYRIDKWENQPERLEVWVEKDALIGVVSGACSALDVPQFSCRGYVSQSEMWTASQRIYRHIEAGQRVTVLHLGDHDPSGIDMTRDINERLLLFLASDRAREFDYKTDPEELLDWALEWFRVERLALNMDQVREYAPPPNPAKLTDSRGAGYVEEYGDESWELDALEPRVLASLIEDAVLARRDEELWDEARSREDAQRASLKLVVDRWRDVLRFLEGNTR